jgi:diguanylate cyclase (GGDEF)-like protein
VFALKSAAINVKLTVSSGISSYPMGAVSSEELFTICKAALEKAEKDGGNRIKVAGESSRHGEHGQTTNTNTHHLRNDSFIKVLDEELIRCSRYRLSFSLIILAVTNLEAKGLNIDSVVKAGIMRATFKLLNAGIRNIDKGYLYTESRFAVILPNTGFDGALAVSDKLVQTLSRNPVARNNGTDINISVNAGIATFPSDELSREGLLRRAEEALQLSIDKGANQVVAVSQIAQASRKGGRDIDALIGKIREAGPASIYSLLSALDLTEHYKHSHSQAVAKLSMGIGVNMRLSNMSVRRLRVMGLLHDLGKVCLPEDTITKPGALLDDEWDMMMKHPQISVNMLEQFSDFSYCCLPILAHHERPDGKGYPKGIKSEQIPLESKIIAVAEAYDDMVTARPYRQAVLRDEAIEELKNKSGSQFDTAVVKALIKTVMSLENTHSAN